mmetsp:Transcript_6576/g.11599  ORF Transcript_6576/g.11599 Transcript_6576/m.11599 type:complete len:209 (-) Transcript_6576:119-745(-)
MGKPGAFAASLALAAGAAYTISRAVQKTKCSKWSCSCGKVKGTVRVGKLDYTSVRCFCRSCRNFDAWCTEIKGHKGSVSGEDGGTNILQLCKSDIDLESGGEFIKCAQYKKDSLLSRFYASCCGTPLFNSVEKSGFVGLLAANLEDQGAAFAPYGYFHQEEAPVPVKVTEKTPMANVPAFLLNMARFMPWMNAAPFIDFTQPIELIKV